MHINERFSRFVVYPKTLSESKHKQNLFFLLSIIFNAVTCFGFYFSLKKKISKEIPQSHLPIKDTALQILNPEKSSSGNSGALIESRAPEEARPLSPNPHANNSAIVPAHPNPKGNLAIIPQYKGIKSDLIFLSNDLESLQDSGLALYLKSISQIGEPPELKQTLAVTEGEFYQYKCVIKKTEHPKVHLFCMKIGNKELSVPIKEVEEGKGEFQYQYQCDNRIIWSSLSFTKDQLSVMMICLKAKVEGCYLSTHSFMMGSGLIFLSDEEKQLRYTVSKAGILMPITQEGIDKLARELKLKSAEYQLKIVKHAVSLVTSGYEQQQKKNQEKTHKHVLELKEKKEKRLMLENK